MLRVVEQLDGPFLLSPFVLAELDYMLIERHGQEQQLALLSQVVDGVYELAEFGRADVEAARMVMGTMRTCGSDWPTPQSWFWRRSTTPADVLSFDHRHFRAMRGPGRPPFRFLPDDFPA